MVRLGNAVLALDDDATSVAEAIRLRNALDPLLVEDALEHAAAGDVTEMRAHLGRMETAADDGDVAAFLRANWALHARIAETTPSGILRSFYLGLLEVIEGHTLSVHTAEEDSAARDLQLRYQVHADLVDAIADRDRRALEVIRAHNTAGATDRDA